MRRLKTRRGRNIKPDYKRALLPFLTGIAVGLAFFIFYKTERKPQIYVKKLPPAPQVVIPEVEKPVLPRIAIVLDDFGYNDKNVDAVFNLKRPITFSILPFHPYSKTISTRVHEKGYEQILHLPLEPYEKEKNVKPESNAINGTMKKEEVINKLKKALEDVPFATGVSNHQGSKATEDETLMQIIFMELKNRKLFFLDSVVTNKSICRKAARNIGIGFCRRNVFLDNKDDLEYIRGQMQQLVRKAKKSGSAIGVGHDREKTIAAVSKLMPEMEKEGVQFVFLSELIR